MRKSDLANAVNWFFSGGYKTVAKNPGAAKQSQIASAVVNLERAAKVMGLEMSDCVTFAYKHNQMKKK